MPAFKDKKFDRWFAKFYYRDWQDNNRQKWKWGFATKKEALAYEREFLEKQSNNPDMTFQSLWTLSGGHDRQTEIFHHTDEEAYI